jgi:outer membrane receptor protein involved in Fe transport
VGGSNQLLPTYCSSGLAQEGFPNRAPSTYNSDSTRNYEIGAKNLIGDTLLLATSAYWIKWSNIQQYVYVGCDCRLRSRNLGTAVSKSFDLQATLMSGAFHMDLAGDYTDARFTAVANRAACASGRRNPWPSALQDPRTAQYYPYTDTLPLNCVTSSERGSIWETGLSRCSATTSSTRTRCSTISSQRPIHTTRRARPPCSRASARIAR